MIIHLLPNFGYKKLNGSGGITRTNIHWHLRPSLWLSLCTQQSNFSQDTPTQDDVPSNQGLLQTYKFRKYSKNKLFLIIWTLAVTLTLKIAKQFFSMTLLSRGNIPQYQVTKGLAVWEIPFWQNLDRWTHGHNDSNTSPLTSLRQGIIIPNKQM